MGSNRDSFLNSENGPNYTTVLSSAGVFRTEFYISLLGDDPLDRIPGVCSRAWSIQLQAFSDFTVDCRCLWDLSPESRAIEANCCTQAIALIDPGPCTTVTSVAGKIGIRIWHADSGETHGCGLVLRACFGCLVGARGASSNQNFKHQCESWAENRSDSQSRRWFVCDRRATEGCTPVLAFRLETEAKMPENKTKATKNEMPLKRSLGLLDAVGLSVSTLAPTLAMSFNTIFAVQAAAAAPLAFLIGTVAMLLVGFCFVAFEKRISTHGSVYSYIRHTFGRRWGFAAGWAMLSYYSIIFSTCAALFGNGLSVLLSEFGIHQSIGCCYPVSARPHLNRRATPRLHLRRKSSPRLGRQLSVQLGLWV